MSRHAQVQNGHPIARSALTELDQVKLAFNHTILHPLRIPVRNRESPPPPPPLSSRAIVSAIRKINYLLPNER
jgi:hypothetical protein